MGDKKFVVFIVFISFAITGVLQYNRSSETPHIAPYLNAMESSLCVFGEGSPNEFYSLNSQLKPGIGNDILPVGYFVEEQRIIEEFTREKQIKSILYRDEPTDYISFYISLTNGMNMYNDTFELKMKGKKSYDLIIPVGDRQFRMINNNHRITHKIRANDSLYKLAKRYYNDGSKWTEIYQANRNKMPDPHSLKIGQDLFIPNITVSSKDGRNKIIKT